LAAEIWKVEAFGFECSGFRVRCVNFKKRVVSMVLFILSWRRCAMECCPGR
jgi:hypothetical protein